MDSWPVGQRRCRSRIGAEPELAERRARQIRADADPTVTEVLQPRRITVQEAVETFLNDEEARGLKPVSRSKQC